jgi:hypothetical protein
MSKELPKKDEVIKALESLTQEPGFIYSLAMILCNDLFLDASEAADIDWRERISFQEASFLLGLMVKYPIDISNIPKEDASREQTAKVYELFKQLQVAHNAPMFEKLDKAFNKEEAPKSELEVAADDFWSRGEVMMEPIFYGGSGAYDFQYLEFASKRYADDDAWIQKNKGIAISIMVGIATHLKSFHEKKWMEELRKAKTFEDFCKAALSVFCFNRENIALPSMEAAEMFIKAFSVIPGTVNQKLDSVGGYNAVDSHPIVVLGENLYFMPIGFNLSQSIYESPLYWMGADEKYRDTAFKHRGDATEKFAQEILEPVFGKNNVYKNVKVYKNKNRKELLTDIDVLAIAGNKAVIVQAKSKKLTELSKRGDDEKLKEDFKEGVQKAYDQGIICRKAITDKNNVLVANDGTELKLGEFIDDAYIVCLMTDHYPAITHQVEVFLKKQPGDPTLLAMSIFDFDIIAFYLKDPFELLYYLRQRIQLSDYHKASSEMAYIGAHLRQKLFRRPDADHELLDETFAQLIDANFPAAKGHQPQTKANERLRHKWKNEKFQKMIDQVKQTGEPGFTDAIFFLYDLSGDSADDLMEVMEKTKRKALQDKQMHDFSAIYDHGKSGITFLTAFPAEKMHFYLMRVARARKYKTKADVWLALGSVANSPNIIDSIGFNKQPWIEDKELEKLSKTALVQGRQMDQRGNKVGRNDPCPCGSKNKFKRCHGK